MSKYVRTPLRLDTRRRIFYNATFLEPSIEKIKEFLEMYDYMHTIEFAKDVMEYMEIKANNAVEGLNDDLSEIDEAINNKTSISKSKNKELLI